MRFSPLVGLFLACSAAGCMVAAPKSAPPPVDPAAPATVVVPEEKSKLESSVKNAELDKDTERKEAEKPKVQEDEVRTEATFGLGLAGTGSGGGGTGEGIGLGTIGTLGHGAGTGTGSGYGSGGGGLGASGGKKRGRVAAATATTSGSGIPTEVIQRIVRSNISTIQACYEKAMTKAPSLAGKVAVKFVINADGSVSSAAASDTNITDADMVSCVCGAVKKMAFPQPDGGAMVVTYPFNFSSADP